MSIAPGDNPATGSGAAKLKLLVKLTEVKCHRVWFETHPGYAAR